jgi:hypothetical protein
VLPQIGDEGAEQLCEGLLHEPELLHLYLERNGLTDDGIRSVLRLMGKHGSLDVTSSTEGCSLLLQTKYSVAKLTLFLGPILAGLEFVSEPAQLLSCERMFCCL